MTIDDETKAKIYAVVSDALAGTRDVDPIDVDVAKVSDQHVTMFVTAPACGAPVVTYRDKLFACDKPRVHEGLHACSTFSMGACRSNRDAETRPPDPRHTCPTCRRNPGTCQACAEVYAASMVHHWQRSTKEHRT